MLTNDIQIYTRIDGELISNFRLREFQNALGWVILHDKVPWGLEMTRAALNARYPTWLIQILVTNCTRTRQQITERR